MFHFKKVKEHKDKIYTCAICRICENMNNKPQAIFLSDIFLVEKDNKFVNYFNEEESFDLFSGVAKEGDIVLLIMDIKDKTKEDAFWDMVFDKNYCKDRIDVMNEFLNNDIVVLRSNDFERYRNVLKMDKLLQTRYENNINGKILMLKK